MIQRTALANCVCVDNQSLCALTSSRPHFASSPGAASLSSPSFCCCLRKRWCEPASLADLSISSPTLGRLRSLWQVTAQAEVARRSSGVFGSMPASWSTSSISLPAGIRRSLISRHRRSERCAAVLLSPSSGGACPSSRVEGCRVWWTRRLIKILVDGCEAVPIGLRFGWSNSFPPTVCISYHFCQTFHAL